ncbi:hypothetical protein QTJ16_001077 [Diplocarpon rosae]|uniref:TM7S3/TM198-like domain-containing protein n=1 Tax=Diplocarpon rosae TaxID=946125 RepID=A0AAD9WFX0_9HELO|nr:hypothetical protein QTJ16_001077 [Diplocarpon rosae]
MERLYAMRSFLPTLLLCFCAFFPVADQQVIVKRQDGKITPPTTDLAVSTTSSNRPSQTTETMAGTNQENNSAADQSRFTSPSATPSSSPTSSSTSAASAADSAIAPISNINGAAPTSLVNLSTYNSTLTPGKLPITPRVTPAFGITGVILMLSGTVYTLVGLKNKLLHTSLSAGYLSSLAVTVLILYVMNPPISDASQGAYLVAIVITGLIFGGISAVFTEMTEGLGCLLGGFCVSMWLLVLKPGGLLAGTSSKSIFIAALTVAAFASSFSHYTRPYGMISGVSFAGATAVVLGIDCFSRAGLKEFWAYVWNLNDNLFPIGATSYPITRGMKVEIIAMIIFFVAGMVSQLKLWKVTKERREERDLKRLQDKRTMEQEEESVGRRIEHATAEDRKHWEATYGENGRVKPSEPASRDSGVGDMESGKGPRSDVPSVRRSGDDIEIAEISPPTLETGPGLPMSSEGQLGSIMVRVASEMESSQILDEDGASTEQIQNFDNRMSPRNSVLSRRKEEQVLVVGAGGLERRSSQQDCKRKSLGPDITPLPFEIPEGDCASDGSVATFAEGHERVYKRNPEHLSITSLFTRKLSGESARSHGSSRNFVSGEGVSMEDLTISRAIEDDKASSLAATMDGLSDNDDLGSIEFPYDNEVDTTEVVGRESASSTLDRNSVLATATEKLNVKDDEALAPTIGQPSISNTDPDFTLGNNHSGESGKETNAPSVVSAVATKPAKITKNRLPPQVSKLVMLYRTNEWAKHLSGANAPEVEDLKLDERPSQNEKMTEIVAPVNIKELLQTAETTARPASRAASQMPNYGPTLTGSSSSLSNATPAGVMRLDASSLYHPYESEISRTASRASQSQIITRRLRSSSSPLISQQIVESPLEGDSPSSPPTIRSTGKCPSPNIPFGASTLMGKRDSMLRSRPLYPGNASCFAPTPKISQPPSHTGSYAGSVYKCPNTNALVHDDDSMSLSARRQMIRRSSLGQPERVVQQTPSAYDSHQSKHQSSAPQPQLRQQQLASWRASVHQDLQAQAVPKTAIERSRSALWHERQQEGQKRMVEQKKRGERDSKFDEMMRRGDMLDAHREALRRMQANANMHA